MWDALVTLADVSDELSLDRNFSNSETDAPDMNTSIGNFVFQEDYNKVRALIDQAQDFIEADDENLSQLNDAISAELADEPNKFSRDVVMTALCDVLED